MALLLKRSKGSCKTFPCYRFSWTLFRYWKPRLSPPEFVAGIAKYFKLDQNLKLINRWELTKNEWEYILKSELSEDVQLWLQAELKQAPHHGKMAIQMVVGMLDGYNQEGKFHVQYNFYKNGVPLEGYYDSDNLGEIYTAYNQAIIGFKSN